MLSEAQLGFFARNGFLHVPRWIDADTCRQMVDHTWRRLPPEWRRDDPSTWTGSVGDSCHIAGLEARLGLLKFQAGDLLQNPLIDGAFASNARGGELGDALLGHPLGKFRVRGLYCIAPMPASNSRRGEPHIEAHPSQLIALCYLEDVAPRGGGLHVWPGSHREIYPSLVRSWSTWRRPPTRLRSLAGWAWSRLKCPAGRATSSSSITGCSMRPA